MNFITPSHFIIDEYFIYTYLQEGGDRLRHKHNTEIITLRTKKEVFKEKKTEWNTLQWYFIDSKQNCKTNPHTHIYKYIIDSSFLWAIECA